LAIERRQGLSVEVHQNDVAKVNDFKGDPSQDRFLGMSVGERCIRHQSVGDDRPDLNKLAGGDRMDIMD
jgi:hypothetical protein